MRRGMVVLLAWAAVALPLGSRAVAADVALERQTEARGDEPVAKLPACNPATNPDCEPPPSGGEKCLSQPANPPSGFARYTCEFTVTDAYGQPAANAPVQMETRWCNKGGSRVRGNATGVTDAQGHETLTINSPRSNVVECALDGSGEPLFHGRSTQVLKQTAVLPAGTRVTLATQVQPRPSVTRAVNGLEAGAGRMDLYQSGPYDKVLLIAEQFDQFEHGQFSRDRRRFWRQLSALMTGLASDGWDIWLVQPHDTGESMHEQAAEFAQAIAAAIQSFPPPTSPLPTCTPRVGVMGFNTGGLVARIATARWEADPAWRTQLGLPAALQVKFVATFDAPHYGMHLNLDMQQSMWEHRTATEITTQTNLDSCAASQFLRGRYDPARDTRSNADFLAFFAQGAPVHFFSKQDGQDHTCAAGPAVATLNAAHGVPGWPSTPFRIGFTQSSATDRTKCFENDADNRNGGGSDLCKFANELSSTRPFRPSVGQTWLRFFADDPSLPDLCPDEFWNVEDKVEWSDLTPGSRSPLFLDGFQGTVTAGPLFCEVFAHQRFPSTLVPFVSAAGRQGPLGGNNYAAVASPFHELHPAAQSRVADVVNVFEGAEMLQRLKQIAPDCAPPVLTQD